MVNMLHNTNCISPYTILVNGSHTANNTFCSQTTKTHTSSSQLIALMPDSNSHCRRASYGTESVTNNG